jgi:hypothetical protein
VRSFYDNSTTYTLTDYNTKRKCFLLKIPDEVLVYIFANLDPSDLKLSSGVCRKWSQVISDDNSWRSAFENYFRSMPLRRITQGSWRREYLTRTGLLK